MGRGGGGGGRRGGRGGGGGSRGGGGLDAQAGFSSRAGFNDTEIFTSEASGRSYTYDPLLHESRAGRLRQIREIDSQSLVTANQWSSIDAADRANPNNRMMRRALAEARQRDIELERNRILRNFRAT